MNFKLLVPLTSRRISSPAALSYASQWQRPGVGGVASMAAVSVGRQIAVQTGRRMNEGRRADAQS